jgi:hypothetical protein
LGAIPIAFLGFVGLLITIVLLVAAWKIIPGFWGMAGRSLLAGLISGVLVLGPGLRLAMRVVAIADSTATPEFSIGGTIGIVVLIGGVLGSIYSVVAVFAREGFSLSKAGASGVVAIALLVFILASPDLRHELLNLGLGAWMNIPMFAAIGFLHGWTSLSLYDRLSKRSLRDAPTIEAMA